MRQHIEREEREGFRSADLLDNAQDAIEKNLAEVVEAARRKAAEPITSTGRCLFCAAVLVPSVLDDVPPRWCDGECRDDWERERQAQARNR